MRIALLLDLAMEGFEFGIGWRVTYDGRSTAIVARSLPLPSLLMAAFLRLRLWIRRSNSGTRTREMSPDGLRIAAACRDQYVAIWSTNSELEVFTDEDEQSKK